MRFVTHFIAITSIGSYLNYMQTEHVVAQEQPFQNQPALGGDPFDGGGGMASVDLSLYKFDGLVRVTYEEKVDGVVLQSKSMAGLIISLEPFTIAVCSSITDRDQGLAKIDLPKDAKRLFRFEMVRIPIRQDDPFGSSGYGGAGGGYGADGGYGGGTPGIAGGGMGGMSTVQFPSVELSYFPVTNADGLIFLATEEVYTPNGSLLPIDLSISKSINPTLGEEDTTFELATSSIPTHLVIGNSEKNNDGQFSLMRVGLTSYFCDGKWMTKQDILAAFLKARETLFDPTTTAPTIASASESASADYVAGMIGGVGGDGRHRAGESQAHLEALIPLIVRIKQVKDEKEKQEVIDDLRNFISLEFDSQRKVKSVELNSLRQRLEKLESDEQALIERKTEVVQERLDALLK